jgi:site-specific recombinase XerD
LFPIPKSTGAEASFMAGNALVPLSPPAEHEPPSAISAPDHASAGRDLRRLAAEALAYADASSAPATRRAYQSAWRAWSTWCDAHAQTSLPASADAVALYLIDGASRLKVSTLQLHRAAIDAAHRAADLAAPDSARLREVWDGIRRTHGEPATKKRALRVTDIRQALKNTPNDVAGLRDRALILVGFAAALRRSELAALFFGQFKSHRNSVSFVDAGLEISIVRAKADQFGAGATIAIPFGQHRETCPVLALRAWLEAAKITDGPVFRAIDRHGRIGNEAISDRTVARIVKLSVKRAGLDAGIYGGHSLRRGMISEAIAGGAGHEPIQAHARHARWDTTRGYIEAENRFRDNAAAKLGL